MNIAENMTNEKLMERVRLKFDVRINTLIGMANDYKHGCVSMTELADCIEWLAPLLGTAAKLYKTAEQAYQLEVAERAHEYMDGKE